MPGTAHRVAHDEPLCQGPIVVAADRAEGEPFASDSRQENRFSVYLTREATAVRDL